MKQMKGVKFESEKPRFDYLSALALEEISKVLAFGAKKYAPNNWRYGMAWSSYIRASLGHIFAFMRGEDNDPETGLSHIAHAGCCVLFLLEYILTGNGVDDRWDERRKMPVAERRMQDSQRRKRKSRKT